ncbi:MAG: YveK family protein [Lachnospiraceae bacterium]
MSQYANQNMNQNVNQNVNRNVNRNVNPNINSNMNPNMNPNMMNQGINMGMPPGAYYYNQGMRPKNQEVTEIDLRELFYVLLGKLHVILLATILGIITGLFVSIVLMTPKYQSSTSIYVLNKQDDSTLTYSDLQTGTQITKDYTELVKSRTVMEKVINRLALNQTYEDMENISYKELAEMVDVSNKTDTRIITITITDTNPVRARDIADAVREAAADHIKAVMDIQAVNVVDYAEIPQTAISPNVMKNAVIGGLLLFVLSCGIIVIFHLFDDTIKTPDDVEKYLSISVLGTIPFEEEFAEDKKKKRKKIKKQRASAAMSATNT